MQFPKGPLLLSLLCSLFAAALASGARPLFNGTDLTGWIIENNGRFTVEDSCLKVNRGTGWLRSEETFGDFTLRLEFRFLEEGANSGIFVRTGATSHDDEKGYPDNGYQIQCMDNLEPPTPLACMIPYGAPPFEHLSDNTALRGAYLPAGAWNVMEISCQGKTIAVRLNGTLVTLAIGIENLAGHIGIQGENGLLEFRRIEIE